MVQEASLITWQSFHYTERTEMDCHCSHIKLLTSTIEALIIPASRTMYATPCCSFIMQSYTIKNPRKHLSYTHRIIIYRSFFLHVHIIFFWKGTFQKLLWKGSGNSTFNLHYKFSKSSWRLVHCTCSYDYMCNCLQFFKCKSEWLISCLQHICMNLSIMNSNLQD